jgi:two-component system invasion response regulator UvrY
MKSSLREKDRVVAASPDCMKILIADDHAVFRRGVINVLSERFPAPAEFGEAETAQAALNLVWGKRWDVMVLDITMPGRSGLEILKQVKQAQPKLPILVLSMHPEEQYAIRVLKAGAAGYITKLKAPNQLVRAVEQVLTGGSYVSSSITERLVKDLRSSAGKAPHEQLSNRESKVLKLIALGKSIKDIAESLCVSPQTVSTHRARMLKKLSLQTSAELIRYAMQQRLTD